MQLPLIAAKTIQKLLPVGLYLFQIETDKIIVHKTDDQSNVLDDNGNPIASLLNLNLLFNKVRNLE